MDAAEAPPQKSTTGPHIKNLSKLRELLWAQKRELEEVSKLVLYSQEKALTSILLIDHRND